MGTRRSCRIRGICSTLRIRVLERGLKREIAAIEARLQEYGEAKGIVSIDDANNITLEALSDVAERRTEAQTALARARGIRGRAHRRARGPSRGAALGADQQASGGFPEAPLGPADCVTPPNNEGFTCLGSWPFTRKVAFQKVQHA
jgi:hypothetical protein